MTLAIALDWSWDMFLSGDAPARPAVESFRKVQWPNLKRELEALLGEYGMQLGDGQEPNWVSPGKAIYWHTQEMVKTAPGQILEAPRSEYEPTTPLPANSAGQIFRYLEKGFRFHPDMEVSVSVETSETAVLAEGDESYTCERHSVGKIDFDSWKLYRRHCLESREPLQEVIPDHIAAWLKETAPAFYCAVHNTAIPTERAAVQHYNGYTVRDGRNRVDYLPYHPDVEAMRLQYAD